MTGQFTPNQSKPIFSGGIGALVALHRFQDGEVWLLRKHQHGDGWITVRRASPEDMETFLKHGAALCAETD